MNGKCDKEIGSAKNGWHTCGRRATVESHRLFHSTPITLEYCERHENSAGVADLPSIRVVKVVRNSHVHEVFRPILNAITSATESAS